MSEIQYKNFQELNKNEGLVFLGAGGNIQEWITGVTNSLFEAGIIKDAIPENIFSDFIVLTTTGGRTDLVMVFAQNGAKIEIGKLALWRLKFGDCSWISDYRVNYANQHGVTIKDEEEETCEFCGETWNECECDTDEDDNRNMLKTVESNKSDK